jgi:hypothetical protein
MAQTAVAKKKRRCSMKKTPAQTYCAIPGAKTCWRSAPRVPSAITKKEGNTCIICRRVELSTTRGREGVSGPHLLSGECEDKGIGDNGKPSHANQDSGPCPDIRDLFRQRSSNDPTEFEHVWRSNQRLRSSEQTGREGDLIELQSQRR